MSSKLYLYARKRVYGAEYGRSDFINTLVKRTLKSVARATGARIHTNKWLRLVQEVAASHATDGRGRQFMEELRGKVNAYKRTHPMTVVRINLIYDIISERVFTAGDARDFGHIVQSHVDAFTVINDVAWVDGVASRLNLYRPSCGHYTNERLTYYGTEDNPSEHQYVCRHCGLQAIADGTRTQTGNGLLLTAYLVDYLDESNRVRQGDRRWSHLRQHTNGRWVHENWSPYTNLIDNYHSSKSKGFRIIDSPWFRSHRRAFGCELEVQVTSGPAQNAAGRVHDVLNPGGAVGEYCYFERDGSIGTGFEMVTQPAGLDIHREKFALFLNNTDIKRGMRSHEGGSCGFHVHVGRQYLTQSQIYRVQAFLNDVRNEALIRMIARRYGAGYCKLKSEMAKFTPHNKHSSDRYEMLNVSGSETVEFRIFRGSLRYESIMAALEFCNALLTFCQPGEVSFTEFNAVGFRKYIQRIDMKHDTKYLRAYLNVNADTDNERAVA